MSRLTVCGLEVYADRGHVVIGGLDNEARPIEIVLDLAECVAMADALSAVRAEAEAYVPTWEREDEDE